MNSEVLVSVVMPVKNGDRWLNETLPAILDQKIDGIIEIITIDSGSTDDTLSILSKYPVTIVPINPEDFNHGLTRNLGAELASGKFVVMTVQDAKPTSSFWLQQLLDGFVDDGVAGVCGQQIVPHHLDKNPVEWYRPISKPMLKRFHFRSAEDFIKLPPKEKLSLCRWDDVNVMYRRDLLIQLPFRKTDFAEDALWARDALMAGYAIVYNPIAQVEHYHHEDYQFAFRRNFIIQYHFNKYFGTLPAKSKKGFLNLLRVIKLLIKEPRVSLTQKWKWLTYNYRNQKARNKSNRILLKSLSNKNEEKLAVLYERVCRSVPQAIKF